MTVTGRVSRWMDYEGYGFAMCDGGLPDAWLHMKEMRKSGIDEDELRVGTKLQFQTRDEGDKCPVAFNIEIIGN
jgi:cold shock CspA family protein